MSIPRVALAETLEVASWSELCDALGESGTADAVKLAADIKAAGDNETKTLIVKRTVTLDLNGHSLDRGLVNQDEDEGLGDVGSNTSVLQVGTGANLTIARALPWPDSFRDVLSAQADSNDRTKRAHSAIQVTHDVSEHGA